VFFVIKIKYMSRMALTNVTYIRHVLPFMVANMQELFVARLVNSDWQDCVENYSVDILHHLCSEYRKKFILHKIYTFIQRSELNWIWYISIDNNIVGTYFTKNEVLHYAIRFNNSLLVEYSIKNKNIEEKYNADFTPLICAAYHGNKECLSLLLEKGANIEDKNNDGNTALIMAARKGHKECISLLLTKGANIDAKDYNGNTALILAVHMGYKKCLSLLLENNANVDAKDDYGKTALHYATLNGHTECKLLLLAKH
jgi:hypothetical protein